MTWNEVQAWVDGADTAAGCHRTMGVEVGCSSRVRVEVWLDECQPEGKRDRWGDERIRTRQSVAKGRTLAAALRRLTLPRRWGAWF